MKNKELGAPLAFLDKAAQHDGPDCLRWPHSHSVAGYGVIKIDRELHYAYRLIVDQSASLQLVPLASSRCRMLGLVAICTLAPALAVHRGNTG
jgi:hypothetical protein